MPIPKKYQFKPTTEEPYGWLSPGLRESLSDTIDRITENNKKKEEAKKTKSEKEEQKWAGKGKKSSLEDIFRKGMTFLFGDPTQTYEITDENGNFNFEEVGKAAANPAYRTKLQNQLDKKAYSDIIEPYMSALLMASGQLARNTSISFGEAGNGMGEENLITDPLTPLNIKQRPKTALGGVSQRTYLQVVGGRPAQKKEFIKAGYIEGQPGDYGLVQTATRALNKKRKDSIPVYQTMPDTISRKNLILLDTLYNNALDGNDYWFARPEAVLPHAGSYPTAVYIDPRTNVIYQKSWDLNDYGTDYGGFSKTDLPYQQKIQNFLDQYGLPTVVTTGFQPFMTWEEFEEALNTKNPTTEWQKYIQRPMHKDRYHRVYEKLKPLIYNYMDSTQNNN